jgi:hypothetical protein
MVKFFTKFFFNFILLLDSRDNFFENVCDGNPNYNIGVKMSEDEFNFLKQQKQKMNKKYEKK